VFLCERERFSLNKTVSRERERERERERVLVYFVHIVLLLFGLDNVFVMRFVIEAFQDWRQTERTPYTKATASWRVQSRAC